MKATQNQQAEGVSIVERVGRSVDRVFAKLGLKKSSSETAMSIREQHTALIESESRYTAEERADIRRKVAASPGTDAALAEGDAVWAQYQERLKSGELRGGRGSSGDADR